MSVKMKAFLFIVVLVMGTGLFYLTTLGFFRSQDDYSWVLLSEAPPIGEHAAPLVSIVFFNENEGIAISPITVDKTNDGGKSFTSVHNWDYDGFSEIVLSKGQLWIVGAYKNKPRILQTDSRGFSWNNWKTINFTKSVSDSLNKKFDLFRDICFDGANDAWVVGDRGIVKITQESDTWAASDIFPTEHDMYGVLCSKSGEIWAVGNSSSVYRYKRGWEKIEVGGVNKEYDFHRIVSFGNEIWILGGRLVGDTDKHFRGILLKSKDGGQNWIEKTPRSALFLNDIFIHNKKGWLIGNRGEIYSTLNRGDLWKREKSPTKNDLINIFSLDAENTWIVGGRGTVLKYQNPSE